jgi:hypothetical protein
MCSAKGHVRFAPNSDRKNGLPRKVMTALPPKADMCSAMRKSRHMRSGASQKGERILRHTLVALRDQLRNAVGITFREDCNSASRT